MNAMMSKRVTEGVFLGHDGHRAWIRLYGESSPTYFRHEHWNPQAMTNNYRGRAVRVYTRIDNGLNTIQFI